MAPLSAMAAFSAGVRIAPITAIIVLLSTTGAALGPLGFAMDRILETGLGCAVAILVSLLVAPARAWRAAIETSAQVARLLADHLDALAARERRSRLADGSDPEPLFRTLLRLRHDLVMLRRAMGEPDGSEALRAHLAQPWDQPWSRAVEAGAAALRDIGQALLGRRAPSGLGALAEAAGGYRAAVDEMHRRDLMRSLRTEAAARMFGVEFALEQFQRDLGDLAERGSGNTRPGTRRRARGGDDAPIPGPTPAASPVAGGGRHREAPRPPQGSHSPRR